MKTTILFVLMLPLTFFLTGCDSQQRKDKAAIREGVAEFNRIPVPRPPDEVYQHQIHTSKGRLVISSCEGTKTEDGRMTFEGPSRPKGLFLAPRMEWASDAEEATRLLLDDYEKGNCAPDFPVE